MIDDYDDLTVEETLDAVADFEGDELAEFIEFEAANKGRTGVLDPLEDRLESEPEDAESDDGEESADPDPEPVEAESVDGPDPSAYDGSETVTVTVEEYGYAAGLFFDSAGEEQTVEHTLRIERALRDGRLIEVEA